MNRRVNLLKSLVEIPSPSGFEDAIANFIKAELLKFLPRSKVQIDANKNVIATVQGKTDRIVMVDAHIDEIGWMVTNITDEGFITLSYIGGGCNVILTTQHLTILTESGGINAVVNRRHAHLIDDEDDNDSAIQEIYDVQVDVGIRKRSQVAKYIKIGDPVVLKPQFNHLLDDFYSGYGLDDKSGCLMQLETIRNIVKNEVKPEATLIFVFSAQEETGTSKLEPVVREYKPDQLISIDVTFGTDYLRGEQLDIEVGRCHLGKGIVLYRGINMHHHSVQLLSRLAKQHKIKMQYQASVGDKGYNALAMTNMNQGVKTLVIGIPLRNMHTPTETICLKDINYGINLLTYYLSSKQLCRILEK